jgi:hypothetical protein
MIDLKYLHCHRGSFEPVTESHVSVSLTGMDEEDVYSLLDQLVKKISASEMLQHISKEDAQEYYGESMDK